MLNNVLLTGSSGFLGGILDEELTNKGIVVTRLGRSIGQDIRVDIQNPFTIAEKRIDVVIHAAGKSHFVPKTKDEAHSFYRTNVEGTKNLCQALERSGTLPKGFIFISSVSVYGLDEGYNIPESAPLNGKTPYAESKILAESWLTEWAEGHNVILGILRLPLIAGANPPGNLGAMIRGIKTGKYLSIGEATARKSVVWARDIPRFISSITQKGGVYNLTDGYHPTFGELEESIASALHKQKPTKVPYWVAKVLAKVGDRAGLGFPINSDKLQKITSTLTFDDSKARKELGWNPTPVLSKIEEII